MTEIHKIECDSCHVLANLKVSYFGNYNLSPKGWHYVSDIGEDYCPKCYKKYQECLKRCMLNANK